jgi:hypothetical protein
VRSIRLPRHSALARALLAAGVLAYAVHLSASDRGVVDWVVIGLAATVVLWNVVQLGRLLHARGGGRALWHGQRTLLFWILGLGNTVWVAPEDAGTWRVWVGGVLLVIAVADTAVLIRRERTFLRASAPGEDAGTVR